MIDDIEFKQLKRKADQARQTRDRAAGQLDGVMARLKDEFNCGTLAEAEKKLTALTKKAGQAERKYNTAVEEFEEAWANYATD